MKPVDGNIKRSAEEAQGGAGTCAIRQVAADRVIGWICAVGRFLFWSAAFVVMLPFAVTALVVTGRP